ncbi:hypothetical protein V0R37_22515, partial [Pollutimonas sp. H1-120]|uniref:hypothetical protein n=1 Tax=Pollutimonas sp. H1-120 TaxID=3148824 RepID=UPI003B52E23F
SKAALNDDTLILRMIKVSLSHPAGKQEKNKIGNETKHNQGQTGREVMLGTDNTEKKHRRECDLKNQF